MRTAQPFWQIRAAKNDPRIGELLIYGEIGSDNAFSFFFDEDELVTPKGFRKDLDALGEIDEIKVYINSPGGDTFAGQAIHSVLVRHPAPVTVYVDGIAASAASLVAMAGDRIIMPSNAMLMIHNPFTVIRGNAAEFRKMADTLDSVREAMVGAYKRKSSLKDDEIRSMLDDETWMTADEAVEMGFADEVEKKKTVKAEMVGSRIVSFNGVMLNLANFKNTAALTERLAQVCDGPGGQLTKRDAERALVKGGFPWSLAKAVAVRGMTEPDEPDVSDDEDTVDDGPLVPSTPDEPRSEPTAQLRNVYLRTLAAHGARMAGE